MKRIILASGSQYRHAQLASLGLPFMRHAADIDETPLDHETPSDTAQRLALQKAVAVSKSYANALVIGCDQVAVCEGKQIGKPGNMERAIAQLTFLQGKAVIFYSAIALIDTTTGQQQEDMVETHVHYKALSATQIRHYLERDKPFDCAGSFKSEALGIALLSSVSSTDPSALVGLPLISLCRMLTAAGVDVLTDHSNQHTSP